MDNEKNAMIIYDAIRKFNENPEALNNFVSYLITHFDTWMEEFVKNPDGLAAEFKMFSEMDF